MRGKTITTFIAYQAAGQLAALADGQTLELITDAGEDIDNDIRAWCQAVGQELVSAGSTDGTSTYVIRKPPARRAGPRLAAVISDPGLQELLSPLGFALAAALEGAEVSLYFQGPAVRVLAKGFTEKLHGPARPFSRFARAGLARGARPGPAKDRPVAGARRPPVRLRALHAAFQGGQERPGVPRRDRGGVPDVHGNHGPRRHPPVHPVATLDPGAGQPPQRAHASGSMPPAHRATAHPAHIHPTAQPGEPDPPF